jgi:hypothetical protein
MKSRLVTPRARNPGDRTPIEAEPIVDALRFTTHRISSRVRPDDPRRNLIFPCFSEFGCEVVGAMYCIPRMAQQFPGHYTTVVGWHGREYLYRHLVDEFWELDEDQMWLREYSRAFHHESANLRRFEDSLKGSGVVISDQYMGRITKGTQCNSCWREWPSTTRTEACGFCGSKDLRRSLYSDPAGAKADAVLPRPPSAAKVAYARTLLGPRPVGVFARARKCYGRNLPPDFYVGLIELLESLGYTPVWLGEKSTTLPCPVDRVVDFSRAPESRDLETTLAIVSLCEFTVQFWTASTRLAAIARTPYLLFESPEQLWGLKGEEGYRLDLVTTGKRKLAVNHFLNVLNDPKRGLEVVRRCVSEMQRGNYADVIGMVDAPAIVESQRRDFQRRQSPILM